MVIHIDGGLKANWVCYVIEQCTSETVAEWRIWSLIEHYDRVVCFNAFEQWNRVVQRPSRII